MNQPNQSNKIHFNHNPRQPSNQSIVSFEENYVFKTNPSFQLSSESKLKQKSQNWLRDDTDNNEDLLNVNNKRNKRTKTKKQSVEESANPEYLEVLNSQNQKQLQKAKRLVNILTEKNTSFQLENQNLRKYVEFLQDFNLKLKKELMIALRRKNLMDYQNTRDYPYSSSQDKYLSPSVEKSSIQEMFENKYMPKIDVQQPFVESIPTFDRQRQHGFDTLKPQYIQSTAAQSLNKINQQMAYFPTSYPFKNVSQFQQKPQQPPYYWAFKNSSNIKANKLKKVYPTSLQSSILGRSNNYNEQHNLSQAMNYINSSMPMVNEHSPAYFSNNAHTPIPQYEQYLQCVQLPTKGQVQRIVTNPSIVCQRCSEVHISDSKNHKSSKMSTKEQKKISNSTNKVNKSTKCKECLLSRNQQPNRNKNSKSTIPTRSRTLDNSSLRRDEVSKKSKKTNSSNQRSSNQRQRFSISQFCI